MIKDAAPER